MEVRKSLLLVEGKTETYVIKELCALCGIETDKFEVNPQNGISELKTAFKTYLKSTQNYKKIWLIIDADTNFDTAWQSIRDILIRSNKYRNVKSSTTLLKDGLIIHPDDENDIIVGIWIMPNNTDIGMLEDFLVSLIKESDSLYEKSLSVVEMLESERDLHPGLYKKVHKSKAKIHTWLAWQNEPGTSLGTAINKKLFDVDKELCLSFRNWLVELTQ